MLILIDEQKTRWLIRLSPGVLHRIRHVKDDGTQLQLLLKQAFSQVLRRILEEQQSPQKEHNQQSTINHPTQQEDQENVTSIYAAQKRLDLFNSEHTFSGTNNLKLVCD